jgi:hypothetical protein
VFTIGQADADEVIGFGLGSDLVSVISGATATPSDWP